SADGGATFDPLSVTTIASNPGYVARFIMPYTLDSSGDILYGTDYLNFSTNQGGVWSQIGFPNIKSSAGGDLFHPFDKPIDAIAVARSNRDVVYVSVGGEMFVTQDATEGAALFGGAVWKEIDLPDGVSAGALDSITVDPNNPGTAYVVVNGFSAGTPF